MLFRSMAKIPYTDFVTKQENAWNFADGLEQRYGVEPVGSREKEVFNKLNSIGKNIMTPYLNQYQSLTTGSSVTLNAISGALTWTAQQIPGASGLPEEVIMAKIPYTDFVTKQENAWNFADGLEQRYGVICLAFNSFILLSISCVLAVSPRL